jgi:hypothetical protein
VLLIGNWIINVLNWKRANYAVAAFADVCKRHVFSFEWVPPHDSQRHDPSCGSSGYLAQLRIHYINSGLIFSLGDGSSYDISPPYWIVTSRNIAYVVDLDGFEVTLAKENYFENEVWWWGLDSCCTGWGATAGCCEHGNRMGISWPAVPLTACLQWICIMELLLVSRTFSVKDVGQNSSFSDCYKNWDNSANEITWYDCLRAGYLRFRSPERTCRHSLWFLWFLCGSS